MKKIILKGAIVAIVFFAALVIISEIMNKGNTDMTTEMGKAVYPLVSVEYGGSMPCTAMPKPWKWDR